MTRFVPLIHCRAVLILLPLLATGSPSSSVLREAAGRRNLMIGTAVRAYALSDAAYSQTLGREFNMLEPEDALKWWILRRNEGIFDFREGDEIARFAQGHRMKIRGHCLVWDHNNPPWLTQAHFTPDQLRRLLQEHIATVMKHYAGQVFAWDVVNEAFDERGTLKDSPWYNRPGIGASQKGTAYIERALRWAHDADPGALLFYNEGGAEGLNAKSDAVYAMVKDFKQRDVPLDGVGLQMHISHLQADSEAVAKNIARLTALGVQVHITELDVPLMLQPAGGVSQEDLQRQAQIYRNIVHACLENPGCTAIQTWGFTDKYSWIGSHSSGTQGSALVFDRNYKPKPAYTALVEEVSSPANRQH